MAPPRGNINTAKQPESFLQIFEKASAGIAANLPLANETIRTLAHDMPSQIRLVQELADLKQTRFINLVPHGNDALIAMSLYAGDGIVTKITRACYTAHTPLPYVVPPFKSKHMPIGKDGEDGVVIENFPYLDTKTISARDVETMKANLAECGLMFARDDDRASNLGRLPDGSLAVIDGNAVLPKPGSDPETIKRFAAAWQERIERNYPDLYAQGFTFTQSPETSFAMQPRPLPELPQEPKAERRPWYERIMRSHSQENSRTGK